MSDAIRFVRPDRNHMHFPRTSREAFGHDLYPLRGNFTFFERRAICWLRIVGAVILLLIIIGAIK